MCRMFVLPVADHRMLRIRYCILSDGSASRILHPYHCRSPRVGLTIPDRAAWSRGSRGSMYPRGVSMLTRSVLRALVNLKFRDFDVSVAVQPALSRRQIVDSGSAG
jgi:hypothetical protein